MAIPAGSRPQGRDGPRGADRANSAAMPLVPWGSVRASVTLRGSCAPGGVASLRVCPSWPGVPFGEIPAHRLAGAPPSDSQASSPCPSRSSHEAFIAISSRWRGAPTTNAPGRPRSPAQRQPRQSPLGADGPPDRCSRRRQSGSTPARWHPGGGSRRTRSRRRGPHRRPGHNPGTGLDSRARSTPVGHNAWA